MQRLHHDLRVLLLLLPSGLLLLPYIAIALVRWYIVPLPSHHLRRSYLRIASCGAASLKDTLKSRYEPRIHWLVVSNLNLSNRHLCCGNLLLFLLMAERCLVVCALCQGSGLRCQRHPVTVHDVSVRAGSVGATRVLASSLCLHVVREGWHWWRFVFILWVLVLFTLGRYLIRAGCSVRLLHLLLLLLIVEHVLNLRVKSAIFGFFRKLPVCYPLKQSRVVRRWRSDVTVLLLLL